MAKKMELCKHEWEEEYYGTRCKKCNEFYPHGCEPWAPPEEPNPEDYCPYCGKEYEDFSDLGCGHCDRRHPDWDITP